MADVYKVWDLKRAVPLALKILHETLAADDTFKQHFEREARTLQTLQHPNIVRCYGLEESEGLAYILMDYIDGLTLRHEILLHPSGMPAQRIVEVMQPVCAALFYAHNLGLAHCDIKPANILIQRGGAVYLTDFGIARATESSAQAASGTPAYMAPEQIGDAKKGDGKRSGSRWMRGSDDTLRDDTTGRSRPIRGAKPGPAVDIYAMGVTLFEMLSGGQRPFSGAENKVGPPLDPALEEAREEADAARADAAQKNTKERIFWEKINLTAPSLRSVNPNVSPEFEAIVARCLDRDPSRRFSNALDLQYAVEAAARLPGAGVLGGQEPAADDEVLTLTELSDAIRGALDGAQKPGIHQRIKTALRLGVRRWRQAQPRAAVLAASGVLAAALLTAAVFGLTLAFGAGQRAWAAVQAPAETGPAASTQISRSAIARTASPAAETDPTEALAAAAASTAQINPSATSMPSATPSPQPTPIGGGGWIAFASDRGDGAVQIWIMDPQTPGNHRQITNLPEGACQPAWSPDGTKIAFTTPCIGPSIFYIGATIKIVDITTREVSDLPLPRNSFDPDWSPDGESIVYTALMASKAEIHALNLTDQSIRKVSDRGSKSAQPAWSPDGSHLVFVTSSEMYPDMLWLMERSGRSPELVNDSDFFADPIFSPDETRVLATTYRSGFPQLALVELHRPAKPPVPLFKLNYPQRYGAFSPDGQWVAFWSELENNDKGEIMLASIDGTQVRQLTHNKAREFHPAWSKARP